MGEGVGKREFMIRPGFMRGTGGVTFRHFRVICLLTVGIGPAGWRLEGTVD
jgi:hypothetical protein